MNSGRENWLESRYRELLVRVQLLELRVARQEALDAAWRAPPIAGVKVATCGECSPGAGLMLWSGGGHALVWFTGCDRPVVWPRVNLEVRE
jgi:hypothetical protein